MIKFTRYLILPILLLTSSAAVAFNGGAPLTRILTAGVVQSDGSGDLYSSTTINTPVSLANINATTVNAGTLNVTGAETVGGALSVGGAAYILGAMNVTGAANFGNNLHVQGILGVSGAASVDGAFNANSTAHVGGALGVSGAATFDSIVTENNGVNITAGGLNVTGAATFYGQVNFANNWTAIDIESNPTAYPINLASSGLRQKFDLVN